MGFIVPLLGVVASLAGSFGGGGGSAPPPIQPFPPPPTEDTEAVKRREEEERNRRTKARGLSTTILTGGIEDEELELNKPTLLGTQPNV